MTGDYEPIEAIATLVLASLAVLGALVGLRYNRRAVNLSVASKVYRYDGYFIMDVKPTIGSAGVLPVKVEAAPVRVFELVVQDNKVMRRGDGHPGTDGIFTGGVIRGRESKGLSEPIWLPPETDDLVGWLTVVAVKAGWWGKAWITSTFQPVPPKELPPATG